MVRSGCKRGEGHNKCAKGSIRKWESSIGLTSMRIGSMRVINEGEIGHY